MTWSPTNYTGTCQAEVYTFFNFLIQYLGQSPDSNLSSSNSNDMDNEYDFIIVGAGSAGCVVANRLSEIEDWKILLLEVGDEQPLVTEVPGLWPILRGNIIENYKIESEPVICHNYQNNSCNCIRGKVMGGTSSINDMMYVRGNKQDFDDWENLGNTGWSFEDVLPYFKKSEDMQDKTMLNKSQENHATGGYLKVGKFPYKDKNAETIMNAWKELGLNEIDYNSGDQVGTSYSQFTAGDGVRSSANTAFIRPIRGSRPNLSIKTRSLVTQIIIDSNTKKAIGVEYYSTKTTVLYRVYARKEVIVSAGAYESPKLLMLSGIGPADHLREANIKVVQDSPVGRNLHDHIVIKTFTLNLMKKATMLANFKKLENDVKYWMNTHEGTLSNTGMQTVVTFLQTVFDKQPGVPSIQVIFSGSLLKRECSNAYSKITTAYYDEAFISVILLKPKSRGYLKLNTTDPIWSQPIIQLNSLTNVRDFNNLVEGMRIVQRVTKTEALKNSGFIRLFVSECDGFKIDTKDYYKCMIRKYSMSANHPVGTCKMGPRDDKEAVVDPRLRVYGINGLRVIDGSVMPTITRGSLNAPIIMIAEKSSDMIKSDWNVKYK